MITGVHAILFCEDAERVRAFVRDVLGFAGVTGPVTDQGFGLMTSMLVPGG